MENGWPYLCIKKWLIFTNLDQRLSQKVGFLLRWGSPGKQSGRNEGIFSSFGVKKFRKFLTFLYCFTGHKQHITIGQEFLLLF